MGQNAKLTNFLAFKDKNEEKGKFFSAETKLFYLNKFQSEQINNFYHWFINFSN